MLLKHSSLLSKVFIFVLQKWLWGYKVKSVSVKLDEDVIEQLDKYAKLYGLNRSDIIRKAIDIMIKTENEKEIVPAAKVEKIKFLR